MALRRVRVRGDAASMWCQVYFIRDGLEVDTGMHASAQGRRGADCLRRSKPYRAEYSFCFRGQSTSSHLRAERSGVMRCVPRTSSAEKHLRQVGVPPTVVCLSKSNSCVGPRLPSTDEVLRAVQGVSRHITHL